MESFMRMVAMFNTVPWNGGAPILHLSSPAAGSMPPRLPLALANGSLGSESNIAVMTAEPAHVEEVEDAADALGDEAVTHKSIAELTTDLVEQLEKPAKKQKGASPAEIMKVQLKAEAKVAPSPPTSSSTILKDTVIKKKPATKQTGSSPDGMHHAERR